MVALDIKTTSLPTLSPEQTRTIEKLREFQPEAVGYSNCLVASYPDTNLTTQFFIPQIGPQDITGPLTWFQSYGKKDPPVIFRDFTPEEQENLLFAHNVLKLPSLVTTDAVMNCHLTREKLIAKFSYPQETDTVSNLFSLVGFSGDGKTAMSNKLSSIGVSMVSLCGFRGPDQPWTARKALDRLAKEFENGRRPQTLICDMPGYKFADNPAQQRPLGVFDFIATNSMTPIIMARYQPSGELATGMPLEPEVVDDYLQDFTNNSNLYIRRSHNREALFSAFLSQNNDQYRTLSQRLSISG